jgi:phosphate-selective porin OprO/OprP
MAKLESRNLIIASSLALSALLASTGARASTAGIEERLRHLEAELVKLRKESRDAKEAAHKATNVANAAHGKVDPHAPPPPPPVFVSFKNGLYVESEDKKYNFKIGGRIFVDGGGISQPLNGFSNQVGIRQARFDVQGAVAGIYFYKLSYDFAGTQTITGNNQTLGGIRDAYLFIQSPLMKLPFAKDPAYIIIGNMFEPFSLSQQSPILYHDLIERPIAVDTFSPSRHIGLAVGAYGDNWSAKGGVFSTSVEDRTLSPTQGVPAMWGAPHLPGGPNTWWVPTGGSQYFDLAGRLTYAPIKDEHTLLHIGVSGRYHQPNDSTAGNDDRVLNLGARIKSEAFTLNQSLIGTPDLSCGAITAPIPTNVFNTSSYAGKCTKNVETFDVELAAAHGPFSIQAEYIGSRYNRDQVAINQAAYLSALNPATALLNATGAPFMPNGRSAYFDGYYVQGTYWLTGEERAQAYEVNHKHGAAFGQLKIKDRFSAGGWGAWGLTVRYGGVNLNNGPYQGNQLYTLLALANQANNRFAMAYVGNAGIQGGHQQDLTVGLNWYPDPGINFQLNWTRVMNIVAPLNGNANQSYYTGAHPNLLEMRAKVYF